MFVRYPLQPFVLDIVREQCSLLLQRSLRGVNVLDAATEKNDVNGGTDRVL